MPSVWLNSIPQEIIFILLFLSFKIWLPSYRAWCRIILDWHAKPFTKWAPSTFPTFCRFFNVSPTCILCHLHIWLTVSCSWSVLIYHALLLTSCPWFEVHLALVVHEAYAQCLALSLIRHMWPLNKNSFLLFLLPLFLSAYHPSSKQLFL